MTSSRKKADAYGARQLLGAAEGADRKKRDHGTAECAELGVEAEAQAPVQPRAPPSDDPMLRFVDVIRLTGLSRTTIWRRVRAGTFPAPIALGENSCGWKTSWISGPGGWIDAQPRVTYAPVPQVATA